jgi:hypothetical protein
MVATVDQHGAESLSGPKDGRPPIKGAERRDKMSIRTGKESRQARLGILPDAGDVKNGTAGL